MKLTQFIGGCFGTVGFVVSIVAGLYADNAFESILLRAVLAAAVCYVVGATTGYIAEHVAREQARVIADKVAAQDAAAAAKKAEAAAAGQDVAIADGAGTQG